MSFPNAAPGTGLRTPETIGAKRPAKTNCAVPETKCAHATRQLAGYLTNLRNTRFARECVVADAVRIEPVSTSNSLRTGKLTGNFADSGLSRRFLVSIDKEIQSLASKFPMQKEQGIFRTVTGMRTGNWEWVCAASLRSLHNSVQREQSRLRCRDHKFSTRRNDLVHETRKSFLHGQPVPPLNRPAFGTTSQDRLLCENSRTCGHRRTMRTVSIGASRHAAICVRFRGERRWTERAAFTDHDANDPANIAAGARPVLRR